MREPHFLLALRLYLQSFAYLADLLQGCSPLRNKLIPLSHIQANHEIQFDILPAEALRQGCQAEIAELIEVY